MMTRAATNGVIPRFSDTFVPTRPTERNELRLGRLGRTLPIVGANQLRSTREGNRDGSVARPPNAGIQSS